MTFAGSTPFRRSFLRYAKTLKRKQSKPMKAKKPLYGRGQSGAMKTATAQAEVRGVPARFR